MTEEGRLRLRITADSVSRTVDAIHAVFFEGQSIPATERRCAATWLVARQGLPGAYADTFAGFDAERTAGITVFTGERITSASARHILGEESCRALRLLGVKGADVRQALSRAEAGIFRCLERAALDPRNDNPGRYCCGKCSVGLWRNLLAGGLDRREERLERGVASLHSVRDGKGGWRAVPFWYTALALSEMQFGAARRELKYARPIFERTLERKPGSSVYARRRHALARRVLESAGS
jgi:hypothetical protein